MGDIAYLVNQYPSPSHTFIRREIAELERQGVRVRCFSHRRAKSALVDPLDVAELSRTEILLEDGVVRLVAAFVSSLGRQPLRTLRAATAAFRMARGVRGWFHSAAYLMVATALAARFRRNRPSHLHAHFGTNSATVATLCHFLCDVSFSFTAHGPQEFASPDELAIAEKLAVAKFVVTISDAGRRRLAAMFPQHQAKIHLVRCGLDPSWFASATEPTPAAPALLCVARLDEQKNPLLLLRAAAALRNRGETFRLTLVGDGELREQLERYIASANLGDAVAVAGWRTQEEIHHHLSASRALVLSSRDEGLPIAIMEAFALGRPVITTDVGGVSELVQTGKTGWLIPAGDEAALSQAMLECLRAEPRKLDELAAAGRQRVIERHRIEESAAALRRLFFTD